MKNVDALVAILRKMGNKADKTLELIEAKSPELAKLIREKMFMFEDIEDLTKLDISNIVRCVPGKVLTMSLKGTSDSFRKKIYKSVSERVALTIIEDLEILGPVKRKEVESARSEIMDVVSDMISSGKINIEDEIYV
jgi:flagellar motor switch protein FliG